MLKRNQQLKVLCTVNWVDLLLYRCYIDDQLGVYHIMALRYRCSVLENVIVFHSDKVDKDEDQTRTETRTRQLGQWKLLDTSLIILVLTCKR
jgi:hypothetical protein